MRMRRRRRRRRRRMAETGPDNVRERRGLEHSTGWEGRETPCSVFVWPPSYGEKPSDAAESEIVRHHHMVLPPPILTPPVRLQWISMKVKLIFTIYWGIKKWKFQNENIYQVGRFIILILIFIHKWALISIFYKPFIWFKIKILIASVNYTFHSHSQLRVS